MLLPRMIRRPTGRANASLPRDQGGNGRRCIQYPEEALATRELKLGGRLLQVTKFVLTPFPLNEICPDPISPKFVRPHSLRRRGRRLADPISPSAPWAAPRTPTRCGKCCRPKMLHRLDRPARYSDAHLALAQGISPGYCPTCSGKRTSRGGNPMWANHTAVRHRIVTFSGTTIVMLVTALSVQAAPIPPKVQTTSFFANLTGDGTTKVVSAIGPFTILANCQLGSGTKKLTAYLTSKISWFSSLIGSADVPLPIQANQLIGIADIETPAGGGNEVMYFGPGLIGAPQNVVTQDGFYLAIDTYALGLNIFSHDCHLEGTLSFFKVSTEQLQSAVP